MATGGTGRLEILDQAFERQILMIVGSQGGGPSAGEDLFESGIAAQVGPQGQGQDEKPDQVFDAGMVTACQERADGGALGPRIAGDQGLESGQEGHEEGNPLALARGFEGGAGGRGQGAAGVGEQGDLAGLPGEFGGNFRHGGALTEVPTPIVELGFYGLSLEPVPLPAGKIGVLEGERGQGAGTLAEGRSIVGDELADENADGPTIEDDLMQDEEQTVMIGGLAEQQGAKEGIPRQIKRATLELSFDAGGGPVGVWQGGEVYQRKGFTGPWPHGSLKGRAPLGGERRTQDVMATPDLVEGSAQQVNLQPTIEADLMKQVVGVAPRVELFEEPQAFLREGKGRRALLALRGQGRDVKGFLPPKGEQMACQASDGGMLEEHPLGEMNAEEFADARHQTGSEQRIASGVKEVGVHA